MQQWIGHKQVNNTGRNTKVSERDLEGAVGWLELEVKLGQ